MNIPVRSPAPALRLSLALTLAGACAAAELPAGFQESVALSGLTRPTAVRFASDGRVFVAEKSGLIKVFSDLSDATPSVFADLRSNVHDFWDRGLLGFALHPQFPSTPYLYVLYTFDAPIGGSPPTWGDGCPTPPGATGDGCVVSGRLSRIQAAGDSMTGPEQVLINDWCQQYPSHSIGSLAFGLDGALYVSAGDGASFNFVDHGQDGSPVNPCNDPPQQGGALRSQDLRTSSDPVSLDGTVLRLNPDTGAALPDNPLFGGSIPGDDRIIAYGLRNPFRVTVHPLTGELWIGDVGWSTREEINRIVDPNDSLVENFGWPCYEGPSRQPGYDGANLPICESLYGSPGAVTAPYYSYLHSEQVAAGTCPTGSSAITGLAFYDGGSYPPSYDGALFFCDYSRKCIWVMFLGAGGLPDSATRTSFVMGAAAPVELQIGPGGDLFYVDHGGTVRRVRHFAANQPPVAALQASPTSGPVPLTVRFDASASSDPDPGSALSYAWDLDGDALLDDSTLAAPSWTYTTGGARTVRLRVSDAAGASDTEQVVITANDSPPTARIIEPAPGAAWQVAETISFSGEATDPESGPLPPQALHWAVILHHCHHDDPTVCHEHFLQEFPGVAAGSIAAPDHEYPAFLEFRLTATESTGGLRSTASVRVDPRTVPLSFETDPPGLELVYIDSAHPAPFQAEAITGSRVSVAAPSPQTLNGAAYRFVSWSDGGAQSHDLVAASPASYAAVFERLPVPPDWWNPSWTRRVKLTVQNSAIAEDLVDFPLLVKLDRARVDHGATQDSGQDLRFVAADATTVLVHSIEVWNEAGASCAWVKVPRVPRAGSAEPSHIWAYYGNPSAPDGQSGAAVWSSGYAAVWHLHADLLDAAAGGNHATNSGSTNAAGQIADGQSFDGNDSLNAGNRSGLNITGAITLEAWVKIADPGQNAYARIISKKQSRGSSSGYELYYHPSLNQLTAAGGGSNYGVAAGIDLDTGWHHLAATVSGTSARLYVDGADRTTDSTVSSLRTSSHAVSLGKRAGTTGGYFKGRLDEVRISRVARSAAWIAAQYRSMTDGLLQYGPQEGI